MSIVMLQVLPIPANAPTTGTTGIILYSAIAVVLVIGAVVGLLKWLRPSGSEKLKYQEHDKSEALSILRAQCEENRLEIAAARSEIKTLCLEKDRDRERENDREKERDQERDRDREARHELRNQIQTVLMWCETYYGLMIEIKATWMDMPSHLVARIEAMKKPSEIFRRDKT